MSMTIAEMRNALKSIPKYNSAPKWIDRVNNMHDAQVIAVYMRMIGGQNNGH